MVLALAEVLSSKQLRKADQPRAIFGGFAHARHSFCEICLSRRLAGHLDQRNPGCTLRHRKLLNRSNSVLDSLARKKALVQNQRLLTLLR
jgi:hypothetical protein